MFLQTKTKEFFVLHSSFFVSNEFFTLRSSLFTSKQILHSSFFTQLDFPSKFLDVDDRSILADALVTLGSFLYAAEAGTHAARHLVLKRNLTLHASLLGKASHAHHHRLRSAGRNHIKLLVLQNRVVGNETYLASRAILGSDAYLSDLGKTHPVRADL